MKNALTLAASALAIFSGAAPAEDFHFDILINGQKVGTAEFTATHTETKHQSKMVLNVAANGEKETLTMETTVKASGYPVKKSFQVEVPGHVTKIFALFDPSGIQVSLDDSGHLDKKTLVPPKDADLTDKTETWFVSKKPKLGDKATYTAFNIQTLKFESTSVTYVEDSVQKIGTKSYSTHHLQQTTESGKLDLYVDDKGFPVVIDQSTLRLERSE